MTSKIAESLNSAIKNARELPIITLLEYLRGLMQEWTSNNKNIALSIFTKLGKKPEEILNQNYMKSLKLKVSSKNFSSIFHIIIITKYCFFMLLWYQAKKKWDWCKGFFVGSRRWWLHELRFMGCFSIYADIVFDFWPLKEIRTLCAEGMFRRKLHCAVETGHV